MDDPTKNLAALPYAGKYVADDDATIASLDKMAEIREEILHYAVLTILYDGSQEKSDELAKVLASIVMRCGELIEQRLMARTSSDEEGLEHLLHPRQALKPESGR